MGEIIFFWQIKTWIGIDYLFVRLLLRLELTDHCSVDHGIVIDDKWAHLFCPLTAVQATLFFKLSLYHIIVYFQRMHSFHHWVGILIFGFLLSKATTFHEHRRNCCSCIGKKFLASTMSKVADLIQKFFIVFAWQLLDQTWVSHCIRVGSLSCSCLFITHTVSTHRDYFFDKIFQHLTSDLFI